MTSRAATLPFFDRPSGSSGQSKIKQNSPGTIVSRRSRGTAATYSPNWWVSTIGDGELNFSVRNGKRWILTAIATAVYHLREKISISSFDLLQTASHLRLDLLRFHRPIFLTEKVSRAISTGQLKPSPALHFLPINVVVSHDPLGNIHLEDGFALRCFQRLS